MEGTPDLFGGRLAPGMRVERVVRRPHETRVLVAGEDGRAGGLLLRFRYDEQGWWTWHPLDDEELFAFDFDEPQRAAVVAAVEAVAGRDSAAVAALLDEGAGGPEAFWEWVEGVELAVPPGPFEDWEVDALVMENGMLHVQVDMWATEGGELVPRDETLRMHLEAAPEGGLVARLEDLHVL